MSFYRRPDSNAKDKTQGTNVFSATKKRRRSAFERVAHKGRPKNVKGEKDNKKGANINYTCTSHPADPFPILDPKNPSIDQFVVLGNVA